MLIKKYGNFRRVERFPAHVVYSSSDLIIFKLTNELKEFNVLVDILCNEL